MSEKRRRYRYNNGVQNKFFYEDEVIPEGWVKGMVPLTEEEKRRRVEKHKQTCLKKYGVDSIQKLGFVQEKKRQTSLKHYGVDHPHKSQEVKDRIVNTCLEKYGKSSANSVSEVKEKKKQTYIKNYGVDNPSKSVEVRKKTEQTCIKRYGHKTNLQCEETKAKIRQTNLVKYGVKNPNQVPEIREKIKQTNLERYGCEYTWQAESIKEKTKATMLERYGKENYAQTDEYKIKFKNTNLERYGVENPFQSEDTKEKSKQTCLNKYGKEYYQQTDEWKEKFRQTSLKRYGYDNPCKSPVIIAKLANILHGESWQKHTMETNMRKYGVPWVCMHSCVRKFLRESSYNKNFAKLLDDNSLVYQKEFPLYKYVYDFRVNKTLIEINPYPTHNSLWGIGGKNDKGVTSNYHQLRSDKAVEMGYHCIHIFDWDNPEKIIKELLLPKPKIYARSTTIWNISKSEAKEFLIQHHLQGSCNGQRILLGLRDKYGNLVSLMTFGKPRYNKNYEWELLRYCSSYQVVGGAEKLFKYFLKTYNPKSIISYCDKSKFSGNVYKKLNFKLKEEGKPSKHWYGTKDHKHITDNLLRQRGYDQLFNESYGKGTSNEELIIQRGYVPIYDCGQDTYAYLT